MHFNTAEGAEYQRGPETAGELLTVVAQANGFTLEELAANRQNVIADSQATRLLSMALQPMKTKVMAMLAWLVFLFILANLIPKVLEANPATILIFAVITGSVVIAVVSGFFKSMWLFVNVCLDLVGGKAECLEGRVSTSRDVEKAVGMDEFRGDISETFSYAIGTDYLPVDYDAYLAMRPYSGTSCKVYLTPRARFLLSLEPVKLRHA